MLAGCNSGKQMQRDLYARELRLQEDEIYRLEDCIEEYQAIVCSLRKENELLKSSSSTPALTPAETKKVIDDAEEEDSSSLLDDSGWSPDRPRKRPTLPDPEPEEDDVPDVELPSIGLGEAADEPPAPVREASPPPVELPSSTREETLDDAAQSLSEELESIEPPPVDSIPDAPDVEVPSGDAESEAPPFQGSLLPAPVREEATVELFEELPAPALLDSAIHLEPVLTANEVIEPVGSLAPVEVVSLPAASVSLEYHEGPKEPTGERTIVALARPQGPLGQPASFTGTLSLMLRDPARGGRAAKLARWDYSAEEVAEAWRTPQNDPHLDLALILPEQLPMNRPLELWIRLVDGDGVKTLGQCAIQFEQPRSLDAPMDAMPLPAFSLQNQERPEEPRSELQGDWSSRTAVSARDNREEVTVLPYHRGGDPEEASELRLTGYEETELPSAEGPSAEGPTGSDANRAE